MPAKGKPAGIPCARFSWRAGAFVAWPHPPPLPALPSPAAAAAREGLEPQVAGDGAPAGPGAAACGWADWGAARGRRTENAAGAGGGVMVEGPCRGGMFTRPGGEGLDALPFFGDAPFYT